MEATTPMKAIRLKCKDCCNGSPMEVKLCPSTDCPLYPFRMGKNPFRQKREYTDEERAEIAARLSKGRTQPSVSEAASKLSAPEAISKFDASLAEMEDAEFWDTLGISISDLKEKAVQ